MKILKFPNLRQAYNYDCGASVAQSILAYYGIDEKRGAIMKLAGTTKSGTRIKGIKKVFKRYGLKTKSGKFTILGLKEYIAQKNPVILLLQAWTKDKKVNWGENWKDGHYVVAIGYDKNKIYFSDPSSVYITYLSEKELKKRWHDRYQNKKYINFAMAVFGKKPAYNPNKKIKMG
jgi:ABC-type bacteriocin/lantibiotic exporter with double-glycine peptidase domain